MRRLLTTLRVVHKHACCTLPLSRNFDPVPSGLSSTFSSHTSSKWTRRLTTKSPPSVPPPESTSKPATKAEEVKADVEDNASIPPSSTGAMPSAASAHNALVEGDGNSNQPMGPPPTDDELDGGRVLARLAKLARMLKHTLEHEESGQIQMPSMAVELEQEAEEACRIVQVALDKVGRPCSVEELGDRAVENVVAFPSSALNYKDYLRATTLRDHFEEVLVTLHVSPPKDTFLEGQDRPISRLERKRLRERELAGLPPPEEEEGFDDDDEDDEYKNLEVQRQEGIEGYELPELRPITKEELIRRKKYLEKGASISNVLRGFDTALLQVGRVHKVMKGGTTARMRALVVIGNRQGTAGYGEGKSETAQHAIERACRDAKRNLLHLELYKDRTIYHRIKGQFVRSKVTLWPKPEGSGITGNNNYAAIFQLFGIKDIGSKQHGPRNLINSVKALFNALSLIETPERICASRGLKELPRPPPLRRKPKYRPL